MIYMPSVGELVRVKTATGEQRRVRVTGLAENVVYVTTENEYDLASREGRDPIPMMGFPIEDVIEAE